MAPSNKLSFNFSSEPPPNNYIRKPAASARRKQAKVVEAPSVVVDDDWSPLFVPHSDGTPDQTEGKSEVADTSEAQMSSTNAKMGRRADPAKTPAYNSRFKPGTYQSVPQTPLRPGALVYLDDGGIQREYWQPGDGDGVRDSEFPNKPLFKERYRFFQTDLGPIERGTNSPPHYVALDDKAVWDVVSSKIYTIKERAEFWPFDFLSNGVLRANRRHKGRKARFAGHAEDSEAGKSVPWIMAGSKNNSMKYYLTGEEGGYEEVVFNSSTIRPGLANHTTTSTGGRKDGNHTRIPTAAASSSLDNGSKAEYATKRKADQPLNPRHDRPKVGKYLRSTPSPEWPGGVRRLNKPPVMHAKADDEDNGNPPGGSEWSPSARPGAKTVYARYDYGEEGPERINGRLVAPGALTSYARTPYVDGAKTPLLGARTPYQASTLEANTPGPQATVGVPVASYGATEALPSQQPPSWEIVNILREELRLARKERQQAMEERQQEKAERQQEKAERQQEKAERQQDKVELVQMKRMLLKHDEEIWNSKT